MRVWVAVSAVVVQVCLAKSSQAKSSSRSSRTANVPRHVWEARPLPTCNMTYVKLAGAGSATNELIAKRMADRAGIDWSRDPEGKECGLRFKETMASNLGLKRPTTGAGTFLFTFVRDPLERMSNQVRHFGPPDNTLRRHLENFPTDNFMLCSLITSCPAGKPSDLKACQECARSKSNPEGVVGSVLRAYDFIGVVERFDESLVVMAMLLKLRLEDVAYVAINQAGIVGTDGKTVPRQLLDEAVSDSVAFTTNETTLQAPSVSFFQEEEEEEEEEAEAEDALAARDGRSLKATSAWDALVRDRMHGDYVLHNAASASLDATIESLGGRAAFDPILNQFGRIKSRLKKACPSDQLLGPPSATAEIGAPRVFRMDKAINCINSFTTNAMSDVMVRATAKRQPTFETDASCVRMYLKRQPLVLITSTSHSAYADRPPNRNIWDRDSKTPFWVFHEDSWEKAHGRTGLLQSEGLPRFATCVTDVFEARPWLWNALMKDGPIDKFYAYAGNMEPCDQPLRMKSGKVLIRKVAAVSHALSVLDENTVVVWLDTDVTVVRPPDETFMQFVTSYDMSFIPFTTNKGWGDPAIRNFRELKSPFWRIESGIAAYRNTPNTRAIISETITLYRGLLLKLVVDCLADMESKHVCSKLWFQRNVYLDDIFVQSFVLHKHKYKARYGWFSMGCASDCPEYDACQAEKLPLLPPKYFFSHVCQGQTPYTAAWNLERYFLHNIGSGAYSRSFRSGRSSIDPELVFQLHERYNDTMEMRFPNAEMARFEDWYWDDETLKRRQNSGMWPKDMALYEPHEPPVPREIGFIQAVKNADFEAVVRDPSLLFTDDKSGL